VDAIDEIPPHRWDWRLYFDPDRHAADKIYSRWGGFLADMVFDPTRYGIPPVAIKAVDPLQLMTLVVVDQCLQDAGYGGADVDRRHVSIILGASGGAGDVGAQYAVRAEMPRFCGALDAEVAERLPKWTEDTFAGILLNVAAGRAANRFNFGGVNYTIDAACASSLAAVYQGVLELETGRSDMVIAGGVDTVQGPFGYLCFSKTQALSPRGRSNTFDESADGIVISEAIAMVALKRLADAERDGDRIYAVIKGIGGSSDGRAKSMTAPHPEGQIRALKRAYEMAGYSPAAVGLFEAHGTGTVAGDTAELSALTQLLTESGAAPRQAAIGSVKTLIGHTKATAGVAGLIKAVLACHHKVLPPHGRIGRPNAKLTDAASPLYLVDRPLPWVRRGGEPRRASVSAFGFGGTNFHVTLEEYDDAYLPAPIAACRDRWRHELLVWRAADRARLAAAVDAVARQLAAGAVPDLHDLAFTLAEALPPHGATAALVISPDAPLAERVAALAAHLAGGDAPLPAGGFYSDQPLITAGGQVALIFSGQGTQYPGMFHELMVLFPEMQQTLATADTVLAERMAAKGAPQGLLSRIIYPVGVYDDAARAEAAARLTQTDCAQPALGVVEAGLWALMQRLGVRAAMAGGHSYGEYTALYAAGVFSQDELFRVSEARGAFMVAAAAGGDLGTMAALQCDRHAAEAIIAGRADLCVSAHNAPMQTILSGTRAAIAEVVKEMAVTGINAQTLPVGAAFHSPIIAPASAAFGNFINQLELSPPAFPVYSNVTAAPHPADGGEIRALLLRQLVSPVEFVAEIEAMFAAGARVFLNLGPKRVQANLVSQILVDRPHRAVAVDDEDGGLRGLLEGLAALLAEGAPINVRELFAGRDCRRLELDALNDSPRRPAPLPHLWLLNGSGARRASDPQPQPLTLDAVVARQGQAATPALGGVIGHGNGIPTAKQQQPAAGRDGERSEGMGVSAATAAAILPSVQPGHRIGGIAMSRANGGSPRDEPDIQPEPLTDYALMGERQAILADYQETMRRFLETQEAVMTSFFAGRTGSAFAVRSVALRERVAAAQPRPARLAARPAPVVEPVVERVAAPSPLPNAVPEAQPAPAAVVARAPVASPAAAAKGNGAQSAAAVSPTPGKANGGASAPVPTAAPPPVAGASTPIAIDQQSLSDILLGLVEERTGYPREMLAMDRDMEAELGIDSIKRVEIVGALLKALPETARAAAAEVGESLNRQKTLGAIVELLWQGIGKVNGSASHPFELAGAGKSAAHRADAGLPRFTMTASEEPLPAAPVALPQGLYLLTDDGLGVADALARHIEGDGRRVVRLPRAVLTDAAAIESALTGLSQTPVVAVLHLAPLAASPLPLADVAVRWRDEVAINEAAAFALVRRCAGSLKDGGRVILVSGLGGHFARSGGAPTAGLILAGGAPGLAKSIREEWPSSIAKAVDLDPTRPASENALHLFAELAQPAGRSEVGYPGGRRTIFRTVAAPIATGTTARPPLEDGAVVLATGGARGITATLLAGLARPGLTFVLVGRTPLPAAEDPRLAEAADAAALRRLLIAEAKAAGRRVTPAQIEAELNAIQRDREIRANLARLHDAGVRVDYRALDVRDFAATAGLLDDIYRLYGRLDGLVHGAGVIEDRLIVDKTEVSWWSVVSTKVASTLALARAVRADHLRFAVLFTSVAGRYGNSGQADYAAANELLNRLAWQLHRAWGGRVKVAAMNWGPWLPHDGASGMVSEATQRKFEAKGVRLVDAATGEALFRDEIFLAPLADVEVVAGEGPWETHEAKIGALSPAAGGDGAVEATGRDAVESALTPAHGALPLMRRAHFGAAVKRGRVIRRRFTLADDLFLAQHRLDGVPVLPAAVALELIAEAAASLWPDWQVAEVTEFRLLKGVMFAQDAPQEVEIHLLGSEHGDASGFGASAELRGTATPAIVHYRAALRLVDQLPAAERWHEPLRAAPSPLSAHDAYRHLLFHGPAFQTVRRLIGLDRSGIVAEVAPSEPAEFLRDGCGAGGWLFDPGLIDSGPQLALVWSKQLRDSAALPNRFASVRRFAGAGPVQRLLFTLRDSGPMEVQADVAYLDGDDRLSLLIEGMECTANAGLNRLCGWAGEIRM
jgi:acyl transferase domain-containing protein